MSEVRLIDANALHELIDGGYDLNFDEVPETKYELLRMIDEQPTVDAVSVVRCLECEHRFTSGCPMRFDYAPFNNGWFCADGERKQEQ